MTSLTEELTQGLTRTEGIALVALMEHIGLPLGMDAATTTKPNGTRHWTRAMRMAASKRAKAYWRKRRGSK